MGLDPAGALLQLGLHRRHGAGHLYGNGAGGAYHIRTANIAPEVHRDRMCYLSNVTYKLNGTKSNYKAACGPRLVKEVIGNLHVPEDVAVTTNSFMMPFSYGDASCDCPVETSLPR